MPGIENYLGLKTLLTRSNHNDDKLNIKKGSHMNILFQGRQMYQIQ